MNNGKGHSKVHIPPLFMLSMVFFNRDTFIGLIGDYKDVNFSC